MAGIFKILLFVVFALALVICSVWAALAAEVAAAREEKSSLSTSLYPPRTQGIFILRLEGMHAEDLEDPLFGKLFRSIARRGITGSMDRNGRGESRGEIAREFARSLDLGILSGQRFRWGGNRIPWRGESLSSNAKRAGFEVFSRLGFSTGNEFRESGEEMRSPWSEDPDLTSTDREKISRAYHQLANRPWRLATVTLESGRPLKGETLARRTAEGETLSQEGRALQSALFAAGGLIDRVGSNVSVLLLAEGGSGPVPFAMAGEGIRPSPPLDRIQKVSRIHDALAALLGLRPSVHSPPSPLLKALDLNDEEIRSFDRSRARARAAMAAGASKESRRPLTWPYEYYRWLSALSGAAALVIGWRLWVSLRSRSVSEGTSESSPT